MAHAITFDTLAFAKKIEASGLESKHAEAIAEAMRDVFEENLSTAIFTKEDAKVLKSELKTEIVMWIVGLLFAQSALIISAIKFLH